MLQKCFGTVSLNTAKIRDFVLQFLHVVSFLASCSMFILISDIIDSIASWSTDNELHHLRVYVQLLKRRENTAREKKVYLSIGNLLLKIPRVLSVCLLSYNGTPVIENNRETSRSR